MDAPIDFPRPRPRPPEFPVIQTTVRENHRRRGFTFYEQRFSDTASSELWDSMIEELKLDKKRQISGALINGVLRWSVDAPNHPDLVNPNAVVGVVENDWSYPRIEITDREMAPSKIVVDGPTKVRVDMVRVAQYLQRSIRTHPDALLIVEEFDKDEKMYSGALSRFEAPIS